MPTALDKDLTYSVLAAMAGKLARADKKALPGIM